MRNTTNVERSSRCTMRLGKRDGAPSTPCGGSAHPPADCRNDRLQVLRMHIVLCPVIKRHRRDNVAPVPVTRGLQDGACTMSGQ